MEILISAIIGLAALVAIIVAISIFLHRHAEPGAAEFSVLCASTGEKVIDYRVCNALIKGAEPNAFFELAMLGLRIDDIAGIALKLMKKMMGGLWVGGRIFLTTQRLVFIPNSLNRAVQEGLDVVALRLTDVSAIQERFGIGTRIIDFKTKGGALSVRSARAREFAAAVEAARSANRL